MKYLYPAIALLLLTACGKEKEQAIDHSKTDWAYYHLNDNVKMVSEKSVAANTAKDSTGRANPNHENFSDYNTDMYFNEQGKLTQEKKWLDNGKVFEEKKYNGREKMLEYIQYANGMPVVKTTYTWDKTGKINTVTDRKNADNTLIEKTDIRLKGGNPVEKITYNNQGIITDKTEYLYDKDNSIMAENLYLNKETVQYRNTFEYDADKRKIAETRTDPNGKMVSKTTWEYENGRLSTKIDFNENNEIEYSEKFEYDAKGNLVRHTSFSKIDGEMRNEYVYDAKNNKTAWSIQKGDKTEMRAVYTYDKAGLQTSYSISNGEGRVMDARAYKYEYDKKGNWTKKTVMINKQPMFITERKITYYE